MTACCGRSSRGRSVRNWASRTACWCSIRRRFRNQVASRWVSRGSGAVGWGRLRTVRSRCSWVTFRRASIRWWTRGEGRTPPRRMPATREVRSRPGGRRGAELDRLAAPPNAVADRDVVPDDGIATGEKNGRRRSPCHKSAKASRKSSTALADARLRLASSTNARHACGATNSPASTTGNNTTNSHH